MRLSQPSIRSQPRAGAGAGAEAPGPTSLPLAQVRVQEGADEEERDANPRQDEAVAKVALPQISAVIQDVLPVKGEDEASGKGCETCRRRGKRFTPPALIPTHLSVIHAGDKVNRFDLEVVDTPAKA